MRFAVLGPVRAWCGDTELELGPPKQRGLLALLLIQPGHLVAVQEIVDALWGQDPPDSAVNVVQRHIGALRRLFEPGLPARGTSQWLPRCSGGYRLQVDPDSVDLVRFRAMRQEAGRLAESGKPAEATELLIQALALWRGPAALGIPPEVRACPDFTAVDREHLFAVKEAADCALAAGPGLSARVLVTLRQAVAQQPLDEALQARLIVLLAATGHQGEALEVYRTARTRLADELGLDPGPELRAAQKQVLHQTDPAGPAATAADGARFVVGERIAEPDDAGVGSSQGITVTTRPAQLPADLGPFVGRSDELARLHALLPPNGQMPSAVLVTAIGGMAGSGKTTLAVHWAHQVADRFPDGQLYVNLRGFHPTGPMVSPAEAIRSFLDAFAVAAHRIPTGLDAQAALYRTLLAERRVLVVLDNARDSEHVRPLLPASAGCLVLVTSRNQLHGLVAGEAAHSVTLDLLSQADALEFLSRRLGTDRVARESRAAAEIVTRCGRLPLALAVVSARAAVNPAFSLSCIAAELRAHQGSLDAFAGEVPLADVRSVFSWSYDALTPDAARLFRLLGLHPGPDSSIAALASLAGRKPSQVRPLLTELAGAHLVSETQPGRFGCHELLRAYGAELGQAHSSGGS
ncbi:BTAD domain-containing putative transcriptional regulator [Streptomyces sp. NPDC056462]|uniref:AfsR/SARP family transcriptional regulator n=1 Tax=Streptomyces sp. NPDC056462 TaxID=3345826 RepID=UPI0036A8E871